MSMHKGETAAVTGELILFDGACIFCSGFAHFLFRFDRTRRFQFVTAQSETGRALSVIGFVPRKISDTVYDFIARNRYSISGKRACPLPSPALKARLVE